MKLAILVLLAAASFSLACQQVEETPPQQMPQQLKAVETPLAETIPSAALAEPIQVAKIIGLDPDQDARSPEVRFAAITLKKKLPLWKEVLLVPLTSEFEAVRTQIREVAAIENPCSDALPKLYETQLQPIASQSWLSAKTPFDVCLIYPAIASARSLNPELLQAEQLPKKVVRANITVAIDTTNDQQPDVLLVVYCCGKPELDRKSCDLTCSAVYVRAANGQWRIAETQTPC